MVEIWLAGAMILGICCLVFSAVAMLIGFDEVGMRRMAAVGFTTGPLLAFLWPLVVVVSFVTMMGYGLFTTARVIRHRGVNF